MFNHAALHVRVPVSLCICLLLPAFEGVCAYVCLLLPAFEGVRAYVCLHSPHMNVSVYTCASYSPHLNVSVHTCACVGVGGRVFVSFLPHACPSVVFMCRGCEPI